MFKFSLTFVPILTAPYSPLPPVRGGLFSLPETVVFFFKKKVGIRSSTYFIALGRPGIQSVHT